MIVEKKNIMVKIDGALDVAYAHNGNPIVKVGPSTRVEWYQPAYTYQKNGAMLNIPGDNIREVHTIDALANGPLSVQAGDVLTVTKSADNPSPRPINWPEAGWGTRSAVDEAMAIAFVNYDPVDGQLFPPAIGRSTNPIVQFFRGSPIMPSQLKLSRLLTKFDLGEITNDMPNWDAIKSAFSDYWLEGYDNWSTDTKTPAYQHPGYGRDVAWYVSKALIYLNSNVTLEEKADLAASMVEQGLSLVGAFIDGRRHQANGGHMQGRKALLVLAGHLFGIPLMENPNWLGNIFQEDHMHRREPGKTWWFGDWEVMWRRASEFRHPCDRAPSTWSDNEKWAINGYYWHACGSNLGTALAMSHMGLKDAIGRDYVDGIKQFMQGPPAGAKQELIDAGVDIPFGVDFPNPWHGVGFQRQMYDKYDIS